ncbi:hypothetical protein ADEAN_000824300 [Angomonas deanei]|uniref:Uncharacterized protein n=1 Tax=Angomonas deanei TaxID=59799 RepID=A0A7G2CP47_9TRYP|nr:hypothetical protein ADEAN_000824300 [Angomonas deanei]
MSSNNNSSAPKWDATRLSPVLQASLKQFNTHAESYIKQSKANGGNNNNNTNNNTKEGGTTVRRIEPSPLLCRVLAKCTTTVNPFPDLLIDSRCATGSVTNAKSGGIGTACSLWQYHNARGSAHKPVALYLSAEAVWERRATMMVYAVQLLLELHAQHGRRTAALDALPQTQANAYPDCNGADRYRFEEAVVIVCKTDAEAVELVDTFLPLAALSGVDLCHVAEGTQPPPFPYFHHKAGSYDVAAQAKRSSWFASVDDGKKKSEQGGSIGVVLVATLKGILQWEREAAGCTLLSPKAVQQPGGKGLLTPHLAAVVVEDVAHIECSGDTARWLQLLSLFNDRASTRYPYPIFPLTNSSNINNTSSAGAATSYVKPHFLWFSASPLMSLAPAIRYRLHRKNRFYIPLLYAHPFLPPHTAALLPSVPDVSYPSEEIRQVYLLALNEVDRVNQLVEIVERCTCFKRILVLTHHKEIKGLYGELGRRTSFVECGNGSHSTPGSAGQWKLYYTQRTDSSERQRETLLSFLSASRSVLLGWDAFTYCDLMDVDMIIQCHPPQKSLCEREWAEFIQVLHTTADYESEMTKGLLRNPNNTSNHIHMRLSQLWGGLSLRPPLANRLKDTPTVDFSGVETKSAPVCVSFLDTCDLVLTTNYMMQYYFSGGVGSVKPAVEQSSLSSVSAVQVQTSTGATMQPVVVPLKSPSNYGRVPVMNIDYKHPLFVPFICGDRFESLKDTAAPPSPDGKYSGLKPEEIRIDHILKLKLQKEKAVQQAQYGNFSGPQYAGTVLPTYLLPCTPPLITACEKTFEAITTINPSGNTDSKDDGGSKNKTVVSPTSKDGKGKKAAAKEKLSPTEPTPPKEEEKTEAEKKKKVRRGRGTNKLNKKKDDQGGDSS